MRRFNVMLNGSRLMMFPFYVCILICVALLMVKFAMQLYVLCRDIIDIHYLDLITGVLTLVDFVLVAQMLILVAICGYVQFIKTPEQRALQRQDSGVDTWTLISNCTYWLSVWKTGPAPCTASPKCFPDAGYRWKRFTAPRMA